MNTNNRYEYHDRVKNIDLIYPQYNGPHSTEHLTDLNDNLMNLFENMTNLILAFLTRLAAETNFSDNWRIRMLYFYIWLTKHEYESQFDEIELRI